MREDQLIHTDILIVGAGIAGPALACALRHSGLRILLIEKSSEPADTARGDHLQPRTCEILERWGVLDDFFTNGAEKRRGALWHRLDGQRLLYTDIGSLDIPHPYFAFLNHEKIADTFLQAALNDQHSQIIKPIRNWWIEGSESEVSDERMHIRVGLPDGSEVHVKTQLLVGADGRNSRVRKTAGIEVESNLYERPICALFADLDENDPDNNLRVYFTDSQIVSVIPRTGNGCKIGIPVQAEEVPDWRSATETELQQRMDGLLPFLPLRNVRFGDIYPPVNLRTETWVDDRVVLIGDACHAMHPARSQGMNISIRCIDVLANMLNTCPLPFDADTVRGILLNYEAKLRPSIDATLDENHHFGLQMDQLNQQSMTKLIAFLAKTEADPEASKAYSMKAAGY